MAACTGVHADQHEKHRADNCADKGIPGESMASDLPQVKEAEERRRRNNNSIQHPGDIVDDLAH